MGMKYLIKWIIHPHHTHFSTKEGRESPEQNNQTTLNYKLKPAQTTK